jgi:hypothetical protein
MTMERQHLRVELNDGTEHEITIANPSLVAFDRTRLKRGWPAATDAPIVWLTFLAWHHMKAAKLVTCTHPEFEETICVGVESIGRKKAKKGKPATVDPTQPTAVSDSSSASPSPSAPSAPPVTPGSVSPTST